MRCFIQISFFILASFQISFAQYKDGWCECQLYNAKDTVYHCQVSCSISLCAEGFELHCLPFQDTMQDGHYFFYRDWSGDNLLIATGDFRNNQQEGIWKTYYGGDWIRSIESWREGIWHGFIAFYKFHYDEFCEEYISYLAFLGCVEDGIAFGYWVYTLRDQYTCLYGYFDNESNPIGTWLELETPSMKVKNIWENMEYIHGISKNNMHSEKRPKIY